MRQIFKQAFDKNDVIIEPDETVLFVSRSGGVTTQRFGKYLGTDQWGDPVVQFTTQRWFWNSNKDCGYKDAKVITSLPCRRIFSVNHFAKFNAGEAKPRRQGVVFNQSLNIIPPGSGYRVGDEIMSTGCGINGRAGVAQQAGGT